MKSSNRRLRGSEPLRSSTPLRGASIKREYIYLNPCDNAIEMRKGIEKFMQYYNTERHHQGIDNEIPERKYENNKLLIRTHKAA